LKPSTPLLGIPLGVFRHQREGRPPALAQHVDRHFGALEHPLADLSAAAGQAGQDADAPLGLREGDPGPSRGSRAQRRNECASVQHG
jgi:hypothetical protein